MNINATIFGQSVAFIIFVYFCMKYVWPPIVSAIEKRQKEIADGISFAENAKKDFDLTQQKISLQLKQAKKEARTIIDQANELKIQIIDEAKIEAEKERQRIINQAKTDIDIEYQRAKDELRKNVAELAISGAEKIIGCSINESINRDLIDKFLSEL